MCLPISSNSYEVLSSLVVCSLQYIVFACFILQFTSNRGKIPPTQIHDVLYPQTRIHDVLYPQTHIHDRSVSWLGTGKKNPNTHTWPFCFLAWYRQNTTKHTYMTVVSWLGTGKIPPNTHTWPFYFLAWYRQNTPKHTYMTVLFPGLVQAKYPQTHIHDRSVSWLGTG